VFAGLVTLGLAMLVCGPVANRLEGRLRVRRPRGVARPGVAIAGGALADGTAAHESSQNPR
jgi:hypothetical protein